MSENPHTKVTHGVTMDWDALNPCEGYEEELNGIMGRLVEKDAAPLSQEARDELLGRAEYLNNELDERNRRLDKPSGPIWRGM